MLIGGVVLEISRNGVCVGSLAKTFLLVGDGWYSWLVRGHCLCLERVRVFVNAQMAVLHP